MNPQLPPITRFFQQCEPTESMHPSDPRWVDFDDVRGEENVVKAYARSLRRAKSAVWDVKLFSGHRGVGKTSELFRLQKMLEEPQGDDRGFIVLYCDVTEELDLNDLDFPDLLVFVAAQLQSQLPEKLGAFNSVTSYIERVWDDLKVALTSKVSISEVEVNVGFGKLATEIRNQPNARAELREAVERHHTSLLTAVNDILVAADVAARREGFSGLVLIVDGLDKLVYKALDGGRNTHDRLFIERSEQLLDLKVHSIYTVPISLIYSPSFGQLESTVGEHNTPVSMIRLRPDRSASITPDSPGMQKLIEMVSLRCEQAEVDINDVFEDPGVLHYLCEMSGGHPRHLLMFLQSACNELDDLPVTKRAAERAIRKYANSLSREVPDEAWLKLKAFDAPQSDIPKDSLHQSMLLLAFVFEYMNGEIWYEVNPVLKTLDRFNR